MSKGKNKSAVRQNLSEEKRNQYDPNLIEELETYYAESLKSWNVISDELSLSPAVISTWRKKNYPGDVENINEQVKRYLILQKRKSLAPQVDLDYVKIKNNEIILKVLETAHVDGVIGAIIGDTGTSKTTSIREYMKSNNVILLSANRTFKFPVEYLRRIHTHQLIGKDGRGTVNRMYEDIVIELKRKDVMIIIDQADYLNLSAIDIFRSINDEAGVGVVFVGLPSFLSKLRGKDPEIRQVRDRIRVRVELKRFSQSDCKSILDKNFPGLNGYSKDFYDQSLGSIRILSSIVYNVKKMINAGEPLGRSVIEKASSLLERTVLE